MRALPPALIFAIAAGSAFSANAADWNGAYGSVVASSGKVAGGGKSLTFDTNLDGTYGDVVRTASGEDVFAPGFCRGAAIGKTPAEGCGERKSEAGLSIRAGYDWQSGPYVYGIVADINGTQYTDAVSGFATTPDSYVFTRRVKGLTALRGRVGYAMGDWLAYGTAGFARADIDRTFSTTNGFNSFTASEGKDAKGYQVGLGVEKVISGRWSIGLEYLRTSLRDRAPVVRAGPSASTFASNPFLTGNSAGTDIRRSDERFEADQVSFTVSYRFGG